MIEAWLLVGQFREEGSEPMSNIDIHVHKSDYLPKWNEPNLSPTEARHDYKLGVCPDIGRTGI